MPAKPIIDIMPVVRDISLVDAHNKEFEALGYDCRGEFGIPGRRFFTKGGDNRTHHIHIFELSNQTDIQRHLAVRDYLAAHPGQSRRIRLPEKETRRRIFLRQRRLLRREGRIYEGTGTGSTEVAERAEPPGHGVLRLAYVWDARWEFHLIPYPAAAEPDYVSGCASG